jgi:ATP-dependent protease ClpP protease subunit
VAGLLARWRGHAGTAAPAPPAPASVYVSFHAEVNQTTSEALLSTPGGLVASGLGIFNTLRALPIRLTTYNVGSVNSIGNIIFLAGEHRIAARSSSFMFHGVGFDVLQRSRFEERNLLEHLDSIRTDQRILSGIVSERTGIGAEEAERLFLRQAFVGSEEAKARGIVHEVGDINVPEGAPFLQLVFQR